MFLTSKEMRCQVLTPLREVYIINNILFSSENPKWDFIAFNLKATAGFTKQRTV